MPRYTLRNNTPQSGYRITTGRRIVGTVNRVGQETIWTARIGQHVCTGETAQIAFYEVVARQLGFASTAALSAHNRQVRAHNNAARTRVRRTLRGFMRDTGMSARQMPGPVDDEPYSS